MRKTVAIGSVLGLAAVTVLTHDVVAAQGKSMSDVECVLNGCRVVGTPEKDYWCCCEIEGESDCDVIRGDSTSSPAIRVPEIQGETPGSFTPLPRPQKRRTLKPSGVVN